MEADTLLAAAEDLLNYQRDRSHTLKAGRQLGAILLPKKCPASLEDWTTQDDWALAAAMTDLLAARLGHFRKLAGVQTPVTQSAAEHAIALKGELQSKTELKYWSLLWAHYVCMMTTEQIEKVVYQGQRRIQMLIKDARTLYLIPTLAEIERSGSHTMSGADQQEKLSAAQLPVAEPPANRGPGVRLRDTWIDQHVEHNRRDQRIKNNSGVAINGDAANNRFDQRTTNIYHTKPGSTSTSSSDTEGQIIGLIALLLLAGTYYVLLHWPMISLGALIVILVWRTVARGVYVRRHWLDLTDDERLLFTSYALNWLSLTLWLLFIISQTPTIFTTAEFSMERFWLAVTFLTILGNMLMLGISDVMLRISETTVQRDAPNKRRPLRALFEKRSRLWWEQRWAFAAINWFFLALLIVLWVVKQVNFNFIFIPS